MNIKEETKKMKLDAPKLAATTNEQRNAALEAIAVALSNHKDEIFAENEKDMVAAEANNIPQAIIKRLKYGDNKLNDCIKGIHDLMSLEDPLGKVTLNRELDKGLTLKRVSVPIGVIGVIFEARPDALVQISSLCIKSGNCAILKGGKETTNTNKVLFNIIKEAVISAGLPRNSLLQAEAHSEINELLECDEYVDLLIPRGSNSFVRYIMENTKIPVMGHSSGVCHIYVDKTFDLEKAVPVIVDSKIQYAAACNAVETLLFNKGVSDTDVATILDALVDAGVTIRGDKEAATRVNSINNNNYISDEDIMSETEFDTEYNDFKISIKFIDGVDEAINHINYYGSHHTDSILTTDKACSELFMAMVDSASVYTNCSTRFADGFRYGFGAEVGISTGKIHARGPVGLEGLVTYKYKLVGNGDIVDDFASGKREFHHRDL